MNRPTRGNFYLGARTIDGPIESNVLLSTYNYRISPKWITSIGAAVDFSNSGNIGQTIAITRIGEASFFTMGVAFDESKDNVGVNIMFEPRFLPDPRLTSRTGIVVPPTGIFGVDR